MRIKTVMLCGFLLIAGGCDYITHPKPYGIKTTMPGPPEYTKGWEDGCYTGMAAMSNTYYSTFYHFRQDPSMTVNKMYYQAWKDAYHYCRQYVLTFTHESADAGESTDTNK